MSDTIFIAVHVGAGYLSRTKESKYTSACKKACLSAMAVLNQGGSSVQAVTEAIKQLENDPSTNAGYGSNLSLTGKVECDASLMTGKTGTFGAVGAANGLRNPIETPYQMITEAEKGLLSLGRIPPMFLAANGAKDWAKVRGIPTVDDDELIEPNAHEIYLKHIQMLVDEQNSQSTDLGHDTVGAICIDGRGDIAAGVSSGGISLKSPGRVGEAAMYGSGCWAQNEKGDLPGVACSTTGTGEQIMRTMFTYKCVERLLKEDDIQAAVVDTLNKDFLESPMLDIYDQKSVGTIALRSQKSRGKTRVEFWFGHVTEDMGIGYFSDKMKAPKAFVSRKASSNDKLVSRGWLIP
ncbi:threonine aspartase 1-like protein [Mucor lusitanicus]|uniref:Threonine aspartase 1-like protein n=1 Tax=Mucor circinelloides f. lusitanicus TaxID=29924 RepID=A0A8H4BQQ1_MUCCL|nr:threonine aspartase 1-like protein [Mucor lusitanicus]